MFSKGALHDCMHVKTDFLSFFSFFNFFLIILQTVIVNLFQYLSLIGKYNNNRFSFTVIFSRYI